MRKTKQTKLYYPTIKQDTNFPIYVRTKRQKYKLLYVGTRAKMYALKNSKGRFLPKKNYVVRKYKRWFGLFRKVKYD